MPTVRHPRRGAVLASASKLATLRVAAPTTYGFCCDFALKVPRQLPILDAEIVRADSDSPSDTEVRTVRQQAASRLIWFVIAAFIAVAVLTVTPRASAATQAEISGQSVLLGKINATRAEHGLAPLKLSRVLNRPARQHAAYLAREGKLDHTGADGRPFYVRIYRAGYPKTKAVGENLGMSSGCETALADEMIEMWLDSPGHRKNLLSTRWKNIGIAVVAAADCSNTVYNTDFGA